MDYRPNEVYSWDGQGQNIECWDGRRLDLTQLKYDHSKTYSAHSSIPGGSSDELWSAPLFQSLLALTAQGVPREDVDQIILEGHFGVGKGAKMRDLARSIVAAADNLFPQGPHAAVFSSKFADQKILED
jgi:hypothetical protein